MSCERVWAALAFCACGVRPACLVGVRAGAGGCGCVLVGRERGLACVRVAWINGKRGRGNLLVLVPSPSLFLLLWSG